MPAYDKVLEEKKKTVASDVQGDDSEIKASIDEVLNNYLDRKIQSDPSIPESMERIEKKHGRQNVKYELAYKAGNDASPQKKYKQNFKDKKKTDNGKVVVSCLVVLSLVAKVGDRIIPIFINQYKNSRLGVKPIRFWMGVETAKNNLEECNSMKRQMDYAEQNPYQNKLDPLMPPISKVGFLTMVYRFLVAISNSKTGV